VLDILMPEMLEGLKAELERKTDETGVSGVVFSVEEREEYWRSLLQALDKVIAKQVDVSSAVAFSMLLLSSYTALEKSAQNERNWIDKLCVNWAEKIRLTRHDQDRIRLLLSTIHLFQEEKYEQKSAQYMIRKPWFREALLLYILHLEAKGESLEKVGVWKAIAEAIDKPYKQILRGQRPARPKFRKRFSYNRSQKRRHSFA